MIRTILAFFGYVKVPKEAVVLAMDLEEGYKRLSTKFPQNVFLKQLYETAKTITGWLRSGRLLSYGKNKKKKGG